MKKAIALGYRSFLAAIMFAFLSVGVAEVSPAEAANCPGTYKRFRNSYRAFTCYCSASRTIRGSVWGSGVYTDDSSICRAARHAGAVTWRGGNVRVRGARGRTGYRGSHRNGVGSSRYGRWHWSFTVAGRGGGGGGGGGGHATQICRNYAQSAVNQNRQNLRRRCGYRGARWQSNYRAHYNWCLRANYNWRRHETNSRSVALRRCRGHRGLFKSRWDKVRGPGGGWSTGWVRNHRQRICGHRARGCSCYGQNYCGNYRSGQRTVWWPRGCRGPRWVIRCTSVPQ